MQALTIPNWVRDHQSFRRWARSPDCPEKCRIAFINGDIWVDLEPEELYSHNQVKGEVAATLMPLIDASGLGLFVMDGMLLSIPEVGLSTIPDGYYISYKAFRSARVREESGESNGCVELVGTPEMVIEVVSDSSEKKDRDVLPGLYWQAGVTEYWIIDARKEEVDFQILRRNGKGFVPIERSTGGWLRSEVFQKSFRLIRGTDPIGKPLYTLDVK